MEALADKAEAKDSFNAAVSARSRISTLRAELSRMRAELEAEKQTDPLKRIQKLARQASEDGSWVAAASLVKQEQELLTQRKADELRKAEEAAKANRDAQALKMDAVEHLRALPVQLRREILGLTGDE